VETPNANPQTDEPPATDTTLPAETIRQILRDQAEALPNYSGLLTMLGSLSGRYIVKIRPWVDHGVRDEEGVPTEFHEPEAWITVSVHLKGSPDGCLASRNFPARDVKLLAAMVRDQIDAECLGSIAVMNSEIRRFWGIVNSLRTQASKLQQLRRPSCEVI
jgi:hypothetical protein